ncbi:MAG: twin-arginine translocase subunit TatC [Desulfovibrio sp.]|jgi:sec-independent protein translocase protein TatC|nr:twin-arginine translocase subunit TatC [Desulfovibrio sp.]
MSSEDALQQNVPDGASDANVAEDFTENVFSGPEWRSEAILSEDDIESAASHSDSPPGFAQDSAGGPPFAPYVTDAAQLASADTLATRADDLPLPAGQEESPASKMPLMEHLYELRVRLVRCCIAVGLAFFVCWSVVEPIFNTLVNPLLAVLPANSTAIYTTLPEGFFTRMFIAFMCSLFLASPVIFYQMWCFIAPGLYDEEKRFIIPIALVSAFFFIAGGSFCYFVVFPYAFSFFVSFSTESIVVMPKISDYLDFVLKLILAFGLIFEMPLFAFFLARMGLVTAAIMRKVRRYAVLTIFIVAAILTPPDVVSQLLMACPMLMLYEVSILVASAFGRGGVKPDAGKDKAEEKQ